MKAADLIRESGVCEEEVRGKEMKILWRAL